MIIRKRFLGIPLVRRGVRRRFVVGYWVIVIALVGSASLGLRSDDTFFGMPSEWPFMFIGLTMMFLSAGEGSRGVVRDFEEHARKGREPADFSFMAAADIARQKQAEKDSRFDERETSLRNAAHYRAYTILRWLALTSFFCLVPQNLKVPVQAREALVTIIFLLFWCLPSSFILWNEPDIEDSNEG
jgi:hypothetical protein